ncbi:MAG: hypothetical protein R3B09_32475 [Nannocystaceae bacterium]
MITALLAAAAVLLTIALPTFPDGLSAPILAYLALCGLAGVGGLLRSAAARAQLVLLAPWMLALGVALLVGLLHGNLALQALEDALPYFLFVLGLTAGRGSGSPRLVLAALILVALADGLHSLWLMETFDLSRVRSTYYSHKVILGHLLIGLYAAALLRTLTPSASRLRRGALALAFGLLVAAVIATVSRGMVLGLSLGLFAALAIRRPVRGLGVLVLAAVALTIYASTFWDLGRSYLRLGSSATVDGRVREIQTCLEEFFGSPAFGRGLGAEIVVEGFYVTYVHNMLAYHLWKFGVLGSGLLALPFFSLARQALRASRGLRPTIVGGALSVALYLVTAAAYKSYILVMIVGLAIGATLAIVAESRDEPTDEPTDEAKDGSTGSRGAKDGSRGSRSGGRRRASAGRPGPGAAIPPAAAS